MQGPKRKIVRTWGQHGAHVFVDLECGHTAERRHRTVNVYERVICQDCRQFGPGQKPERDEFPPPEPDEDKPPIFRIYDGP